MRGLTVLAGVWLIAVEMEIDSALWAHVAENELKILFESVILK